MAYIQLLIPENMGQPESDWMVRQSHYESLVTFAPSETFFHAQSSLQKRVWTLSNTQGGLIGSCLLPDKHLFGEELSMRLACLGTWSRLQGEAGPYSCN